MLEKRNRKKRHFFCPVCVQDVQDQPLCIIVAFWGMRIGKLLTVEAVSREFHIPQRTVKDILHYIVHEGRNHIRSRRFIQKEPATGRRRALRILDVQVPQEIPTSSGAKLDCLPCCRDDNKADNQASDKISATTSVDVIQKTE